MAAVLVLVLCPWLTSAEETTTAAEALFQKLRSGGTTPDHVLARILHAVDELECRAKALRDAEHKVSDPEVKREIDSAMKKTGKVLLQTVVFLRGTPMDGKREEIFRMGVECVNVPYSFEAFKTKYNSLEMLDRAPFTSSGKTLNWGQ